MYRRFAEGNKLDLEIRLRYCTYYQYITIYPQKTRERQPSVVSLLRLLAFPHGVDAHRAHYMDYTTKSRPIDRKLYINPSFEYAKTFTPMG